ncbi:hypothetical protein Ciccas_002107 [Cichlidogyrus casuarinus]|uniref:Uncharacterized protein n=1 Tax=Cichlidogyrus casuarinus TaxID=1844966 RepID=A0ABD2QI90_9PLAT
MLSKAKKNSSKSSRNLSKCSGSLDKKVVKRTRGQPSKTASEIKRSPIQVNGIRRGRSNLSPKKLQNSDEVVSLSKNIEVKNSLAKSSRSNRKSLSRDSKKLKNDIIEKPIKRGQGRPKKIGAGDTPSSSEQVNSQESVSDDDVLFIDELLVESGIKRPRPAAAKSKKQEVPAKRGRGRPKKSRDQKSS